MTSTRTQGTRKRLAALTIAAALAAVTGCGSGGFGSTDATTAPKQPVQSYVALGDGFAAGPYLGADTSGNGCLRTEASYPSQVASALGATTFTDVSCTGAGSSALQEQGTAPGSKKKLAPQLDAVTRDTDLITLGIGLENHNLIQEMFHICDAQPCGDDVLYPAMATRLKAFAQEVPGIVRALQEKAPTAKIIIVGYPQITSGTESCPALPSATQQQIGYAYRTLGQVNGDLNSAALQTGATFIDTAALSADHTVCAADPWVGPYATSKKRVQAFAPTAALQKAVADAVVTQARR